MFHCYYVRSVWFDGFVDVMLDVSCEAQVLV